MTAPSMMTPRKWTGEYEGFYWFDNNDNVICEADTTYMDSLNTFTGSGNVVAQLLIGEY